MIQTELNLPVRTMKPRDSGLTVLIDNGVPLNFFIDTISAASAYIDFVKFGWGTSLVTKHLEEKIACLRDQEVEFFFGGTLFEKFLSQKKVGEYYRFCRKYGARHVEISNGTVNITNREKARYITHFADEFSVFSEVGSKDGVKSGTEGPAEWLEYVYQDLEAGADKVITEARESGTTGLCRENGEMRFDIIDEILCSGIDLKKIIFEAPTKKMQSAFIKRMGQNVNLANISFADPIPLETLRLGLRSDTFYLFDEGGN